MAGGENGWIVIDPIARRRAHARPGGSSRRAGGGRAQRLGLAACAVAALLAGGIACAPGDDPQRAVIRITGSDTMVNLLQAWAEEYKRVAPAVVVQVAGGGSGVGIAGLVDGTLDVAAASREIRAAESDRFRRTHAASPAELTVALDALAIYVHRTNPLERIAIDDLAGIYGTQGGLARWSQLGIRHPGCRQDAIIRIGRQNNSGTYAYFRQVVLGSRREYQLGSIDQSGSKDVVALVSGTPCAIGYSGLAYATSGVKHVRVAPRRDGTAVRASAMSVLDGTYPLARALYLYTANPPAPPVAAFLSWVMSPDGQNIVSELGFVPAPRRPVTAPSGMRGR